MGYQEFTYKINNIGLFNEKLEDIKNLMQNYYYNHELNGKVYEGYTNHITLIHFKRNVGNIKKGYQLYITGDRANGKEIILELNTILHQRQGFNYIEEMTYTEKQGKILDDLFEKGKTEYAELILDVVNGKIEIDQDINL